MPHLSRRAKLLIAFFGLVAVGYGAAIWLPSTSKAIPQSFSDSRLKGAAIAQQIVDLTNQSADDLKQINELDQKQNLTEALTRTTDVAKRSQTIRDLAIQLSNQLGTMAQSLSDIKSPEVRQAALEALSNRLALMSRLVNYSNYLGQLVDALQNRFTGNTVKGEQVAQIVDQINAEITAINNFNRQATDAMERFDKMVNK